ncbi:MAG: peptidylprolyl isomerase [Oscillospiraceae bacterium]|nr:peptidylprolyl isomerase [Oscillospiraceae bacterium]
MSASSKKKIRKEQNAEMLTERQLKEQAEAKSLKRLTVVFSVVMIAIVAAFLITNLVGSVNRSGVIEKNTVAATIGEHELNTVVMNYYFYSAVTNEYNSAANLYGDYAENYLKTKGLDLTKPLDEQLYDEKTGMTWADYFMDEAIEAAKGDYALYDLAIADNFELTQESQTSVNNAMMNMQLSAAFSGLGDVDTYLRNLYGNGSTEESYEEFLTISSIAADYYNAKVDSMEYDDAAIRAYEADKFDDYSAYSFASYYLPYTDFLTGGTKDDKGNMTYTDAEKDAARKAAEAASLVLTDATTVEELDKAIAELEAYKDDEKKPTSTPNEDVMHTNLKEDYAKWLAAKDRKAGDVKVFPNTTKSTDADGKETEVTNGYYVLMFQSRNDNLEKLANVRHILISFEGGTKDENGNVTYSVAEKTAAKEKAEKLLQEWKDGEATEESFIALVEKNTGDSGSAKTGGLYEDIHRNSNYMEGFRDWAVDSTRKAGDTGVVETDYGYHIMYYVGDDELSYRDFMIKNAMTSEDITEWYEGVLKEVTVVEGDESKINKDLVYSHSHG